MHLCCGRGTDTQTDKNKRQRSSRFTHAHTRPDIDREAEEGKRKEQRGRGREKRREGWAQLGESRQGAYSIFGQEEVGEGGEGCWQKPEFSLSYLESREPSELSP